MSSARRYPLIQMLRGIAALAIAFLHIQHEALPPNSDASALVNLVPWAAGVDLFFVISGFVIVHASDRMFGQKLGARRFLARRVARIVPLYWAATTIFLLTAALLPQGIRGAMGGPSFILASYLFVPWPRPDGVVQPAFGLGWTLNYEMFFYVLFALALNFVRARALTGLVAGLALFVAWGYLVAPAQPQLAFWSQPIVLEFLFGIIVAGWLRDRVVLGLRSRWGLVAAAIVLLMAHGEAFGLDRAWALGLPAAFLVAAAKLGPQGRLHPGIERLMVTLGDASYAIYLLHPFPMRALGLLRPVWQRLDGGGTAIEIVVSLGLTLAAALAVHRWFELPAMRAMRRWLEPAAAR